MQVNRIGLKQALLSPGKVIDRTLKQDGQDVKTVRTLVGTKTKENGYVDPLKNMAGLTKKLHLNNTFEEYVDMNKNNQLQAKKNQLMSKLNSLSLDSDEISKKDKLLYNDKPEKVDTLGDLFVLQLISKNLKRTRYKQMKYHKQTEEKLVRKKSGESVKLNYTNSYYRKNAASLLRPLSYEQKGMIKISYGVDNVFLSLVIEIITNYHKSHGDSVRDLKKIYNLTSRNNKEEKIKGLLYYFDLMDLFIKRGKNNRRVLDKSGNVVFDHTPIDVTEFKRKKGGRKKSGRRNGGRRNGGRRRRRKSQ